MNIFFFHSFAFLFCSFFLFIIIIIISIFFSICEIVEYRLHDTISEMIIVFNILIGSGSGYNTASESDQSNCWERITNWECRTNRLQLRVSLYRPNDDDDFLKSPNFSDKYVCNRWWDCMVHRVRVSFSFRMHLYSFDWLRLGIL